MKNAQIYGLTPPTSDTRLPANPQKFYRVIANQ